jgi:pilus assembly protein CpaE
MANIRSLLVVLSANTREQWSKEIAGLISGPSPVVITGSPADAARQIAENRLSPSHIVLDIGSRGQDVFAEIDQLAQQCEAGTRVLAVGDTNDVVLYRGLLSRGVIDYLPMPASPSEVVRVLTAPPVAPVAKAPHSAGNGEKRVIVFISAASGDGGSTAALNTAYALSQTFNGSTVLVDMDYQFGMVAKNLNLQNQYGIGDLFDHPERGLDATLIKRMVANYGKLHVITAPIELRYLPMVSAEVIRDLVTTLQQSYDNVIIDLPHVWLPWVATVIQQASTVVLVAQLWLKSVSNAARMMRVFREMNISMDRIVTVINRSGAKFKEAIDAKDFERVCGSPIRYTLVNDIKTVVNAEAAARTVMEMEPSELANNIQRLARGISGQAQADGASGRGLFSRLKG